MNVSVETQPNCIATLSVDLPAEKVRAEKAALTEEFRKFARVPGFRPGKAPRPVIQKRFAKEIGEELSDKLIRNTLSEAIREKGLKVLSVTGVEGPVFHPDQSATFQAKVILEPEFDLPDYSRIPAGIRRQEVTAGAVDSFIDSLREHHATFEPIEDRKLVEGDFAVINYRGSLDGRPLGEVLPDCPPQLIERSNAWVLVEDNPMLPGFALALVGLGRGDQKSVTVAFPGDYPTPGLQGKEVSYEVSVEDMQQRVLPEWSDELAAKILPDSTVEQLKERAKQNLEQQSDRKFQSDKEKAAMDFLLNNVQCDIPEAYVRREMRNLLGEIVRENQDRGISDEELEKNQEQIVSAAEQGASTRVRSSFLLLRVAEKEGLKADEKDLTEEVMRISYETQIPVKKLLADLKKRGAFDELRDQILCRKALALLAANVTVDESPATDPS